jgi:hypothetical protein
MGDLLQVIFMFIWKTLNDKENYAMVTCDKVVFLQCMLLNLNCFLTSAIKESGQKKLRSIEYFEPLGYTLENAISRFDVEKEKIFLANQEFIKSIEYLSNNPNINIYVQGYNSPFVFNSNFYRKIYEDLTYLNNNVFNIIKADTLIRSDDVDLLLENIKSNFLFNLFIRKVKNNLKMTLAKKYTKDSKLWNDFQPTLIEYGNKSFLELGRKSYSGGSQYIIGGLRELQHDEYSYFSNLEFDDTPVFFYDNNDNSKIDIANELNKQIRKIIGSLGYSEHYETFRNELYYNFYLRNEVLYDDDLSGLINELITYDLSMPTKDILQYIPQNIITGKRAREIDIDETPEIIFSKKRLIAGNANKSRKYNKKQSKNNKINKNISKKLNSKTRKR